MLDASVTTRQKPSQPGTRDTFRYAAGPVRAVDPQLKARALLALFCRDDVLERRMSAEMREILGIVSRAAKPYVGPTSRRSSRSSGWGH